MSRQPSALSRLHRFLLAVTLSGLALGATVAAAATSPDAVWSDRVESTIARSGESRRIVPSAYRTLALDRARLSAVLARTPGIGSSTALSMQSARQAEVGQGPCTARLGAA